MRPKTWAGSDPLHLKSLFKPRLDAPLPAWMIFPVVFAALYASHFTLLRLPYYWDEAGYYIPAAWDFFRTGSLIPFSTLTNAHPPLPSVYLALWWKASGFLPEVTRTAVLIVAAFGLTAVWRLAMRLVGVPAVAFWTVVLTALYPVWFAQSSLAHADIFAAACTLWGLVYVLPAMNRDLPRKPWIAAVWFSLAALSKETAIVVPLTLAVVSLVESRRAPGRARTRLWSEAAWLAGCLLPLAAWYAFHYFKTGFLFGNPEFLRYNAQANLSPFRILSAFGYRILHLTAHMNLFLPVGIAIAALLLDPLPDPAEASRAPSLRLVSGARVGNHDSQLRPSIDSPALRRILFLFLANALFFSVLGGALLTRYLLPMYPLVLLLVVTTFYRRVPYWHALAVLSAAVFVLGLFLNPPYRFAPEDNLAYARVIRLHQTGINELEKRYPGSTVLSAWPVSDELLRPELGYLDQPFAVYRLEDFTADQIARAAQEPEKYSAALVFSTKYDPPSLPLSLGPKAEAVDERYFGLHHDLPPELIALQLHGDLVWKQEDHGQWIALIRFPRQYDARLESESQPK
jgi:4-amino-4-deoxy-L-arabinose transferase-like glycosyltransferase